MAANLEPGVIHRAAREPSKYPKAVFFIFGNEFCERFSFYGMKAILTLYLARILLYSEDTATIIFHVFSMACYFTPILGAILSDSFLGKFKTIFFVSILYAIGNVAVSLGSIPNDVKTMTIGTFIGLVLIAIGTGGIKPCNSAFGGDQFEPGQEKYLKQFFAWFYFAINLGSVVSTLVSPLLRTSVSCFGEETCYPLAFGVPALLMIVAIAIFLSGKKFYKIIPPAGNIMAKFVKCVGNALLGKIRATGEPKNHWLDYAADKFDNDLIKDIKVFLHVLYLYLPLPLFWALFEQQGSRWTLQAAKMDGDVGAVTIEPDQMQAFNPILIIIFIPVFEYVIYPLMSRCNLATKPLQRMTCGGLLAALAFVAAGCLQLHIESTESSIQNSTQLAVINNSPCKMVMSGSFNAKIMPFEVEHVLEIATGEQYQWKFQPEDCEIENSPSETYDWMSESIQEMVIVTMVESKVIAMKGPITAIQDLAKGHSTFQLFFNFKEKFVAGAISYLLDGPENYIIQSNVTEGAFVGHTNGINIIPGRYEIYPSINETTFSEVSFKSMSISAGNRYALSIYEERIDPHKVNINLHLLVKGNIVPMLYMLPQYFFITGGEIMMSITGLEFSYSQSPTSLKSVLQASWLMTMAIGNLIVVIVTEIHIFEQQSYEFFMFAILMGLDMLLFCYMAHSYKYVEDVGDQENTDDAPAEINN